MALADEIRRFTRVPLLAELDPEAIRLLAFSAETKILQAGDTLFNADTASDGGYVVVSGSLTLEGPPASNQNPQFAGPDTLVAELALFAEVAYSSTAKARETTTVLKIPRTLFHRVLGEFPDAALRVRGLLAKRLGVFAGDLERFAAGENVHRR